MQKINIIYTSDTHGCLFPPRPNAGKTARCSALLGLQGDIHKDGNTLVIDGGDAIQGSALSTYAYKRSLRPNPVATVFNRLGTDIVTLGNHDFNYGLAYLKAYLTDLNAVCVCANVRDKDGVLPIYESRIVTMENGVRIGVTGVCTDYIARWCKKEVLDALVITSPVEAAQRVLKTLKPKCDITVLVYHGGCEKDLATERLLSDTTENQACRIAEEMAYDVLLTGHQHQQIAGRCYHGSWIVQPGSHAETYCRLEIAKDAAEITVASALHMPCAMPQLEKGDPLYDLHSDLAVWMDTALGQLDRALSVEPQPDMALHGSLLANLINTVQLEATGAEISATCLGNKSAGLGTQVTVRDIMAAYEFSNTLVLLEMTGAQLKAYLECSAAFFALENGAVRVSDAFVLPKVEFYNYDYFSGIDYTFDLQKTVGQRVIKMERNGRPVQPADRFRVCVTDYRASGTGIYACLGGCKVLRAYDVEVPDLLIDYLERHKLVAVDTHSYLHIANGSK